MSRLLKLAASLLLVLPIFAWVGCSSPTERYQVLSFFFDGVPNPNAPKKVVKVENNATPVLTLTIVSRHKPFVENQCDSCHRSATGQMVDFTDTYKSCAKCHPKVANQYSHMHGPVARPACQFCHTGHESAYPHLLRADPVKVCTQCHDAQLLGNKPLEHNDGHTNCLNCHGSHGGNEAYFLKPGWNLPVPPIYPTTAPTTQSTTLPAASQPLGPALLSATTQPTTSPGGQVPP